MSAMRRSLPLAMLALFGAVLFAPVASATTNCTTFTNHSGHVPGSYSYAEFHEDSPLVDLTVNTNGQDIFVDPQQYGAGNSWDIVRKCSGTTTTTSTTTTTTTPTTTSSSTTLPQETTTTSTTPEEPTTTTTLAGSTTVPGLVETEWSASSDCSVLVAEWGEGIVQVNLVQRLAEGDFDVDAFTFSGEEIGIEGALASEWIFLPVVETGYVAVPEQISLFTEPCPTSTVSPTVVTTLPEELPFTEPLENAAILAMSGIGLIILGWMILREARR